MTILEITVGIPASGKTTYANWLVTDNEFVNVNRDDLRASVLGGYTGYFEDENLISKIQHTMIDTALKAGRDTVSSDTNLNRKFVRELVKIGKANGADIKFKYFDTPPDTCVERDKNRPDSVGEEVIRNFASRYWNKKTQQVPRFEDLLSEEVTDTVSVKPYVADQSKPKAILVDIDGTIALHNGRNPHDYDSLHTDLPNKPVIDLVNRESNLLVNILFVSGRPDSHFNETLDWISRHVGPHHANNSLLIMRKAGDMRKDSIVKIEIFDEHIRDNYNILYALDDRDQVVKVYRDLGLSVHQVNYGDF